MGTVGQNRGAQGMMKSKHRIILFTCQVHEQSLVHGWVGDQAGDRGKWAVGPVEVAHSGHCPIGVMEFFLRAVVACRDPGDVSSWLSCRGLATATLLLSWVRVTVGGTREEILKSHHFYHSFYFYLIFSVKSPTEKLKNRWYFFSLYDQFMRF